MKTQHWAARAGKRLSFAMAYGCGLLFLLPILQVILSSFKTSQELNRSVGLPSSLNWDNYAKVLSDRTLPLSFMNSVIVTVVAIAISIIVCSFAGYAIGRRKERFFKIAYLFFLSAMMIPVISSVVSLIKILQALGLINSLAGLIVVYTAGAIPMGVLIFSGFIKTIPRELDEAATIDGCGYLRRFRSVILPILKPVISTQVVLSAFGIWNDFLMPLLIIRSDAKRPLTFAVYKYIGERTADFGAVFAFLTLASLLPIIVFILTRKHFFQGMAVGAIKG